MFHFNSVGAILRYNDWANGHILHAAMPLTDEQLDRPFDMGRGTLRRTLLHVWAGEHVWVERWQGHTETPWPDEDERVSVSAVAERFRLVFAGRDSFVSRLTDGDLGRDVTYRDSKGSLFTATLGDMMIQMIVHSTHHRSQAVNMLRRVGAAAPEIDYMMWIRKPAP